MQQTLLLQKNCSLDALDHKTVAMIRFLNRLWNKLVYGSRVQMNYMESHMEWNGRGLLRINSLPHQSVNLKIWIPIYQGTALITRFSVVLTWSPRFRALLDFIAISSTIPLFFRRLFVYRKHDTGPSSVKFPSIAKLPIRFEQVKLTDFSFMDR